MPYSLVDVENQWFLQSPGLRVVLTNGALAVENKFGSKRFYRQPPNDIRRFPTGEWVRLGLHLRFDDGEQGRVEVWQNGVQIINANGITLPTSNSIQTNLELGITATSAATELFMDDVRVDTKPF